MSDIITKEQFEAQGLRGELHMANERIRELEATLQAKQGEIAKLHDKVCCAIRQYRTMCDAFEAAHLDIQEAYEQAEKIRP